jgi:alkylation response protein AidB-like acyl-CoA dehydrogenase
MAGPTRNDELKIIAAEVADGLLVRWPALVEGVNVDGELVRDALSEFAKTGLLDLGYLDPATSGLTTEDLRYAAAVVSVLASRSLSLATIYMVNAVFGGVFVAQIATARQKHDLLPGIRNGTRQMAFAMTEPQAGSDAAALATCAKAIGQGFEISGEKVFITGAASADDVLVVARLEGTHKRALSLFIVPRTTEGLVVEPLPKLAGGTHGSCRLVLNNVRVGPDQVLGGPEQLGKAWSTLRFTGAVERIVVAAAATGLAGAVVQRAIDFARHRQQFGQAIASFQAVQHMLVEMQTAATGMQLFVDYALDMLAAGKPDLGSSMAKYHCAEQLQEIVASGMRIMGGRAYFAHEQMSRYYREAPFSLYAGGTIEIQKTLIARSMGIG